MPGHETHLKGNAVPTPMAGARCAVCGREEFLPYRCKLCSQPHCLEHRLPENHACAGLAGYRARVREDRAMGLAREGVQVKVRKPSGVREAVRRVSRFSRRSATHMLLAAVALTFAAQVVGALGVALAARVDLLAAWGTVECAVSLGPCPGFSAYPWGLPAKPWSPLTTLFAHAGPFHFFINALALYFFGLELESRLGRKALLRLFLGAGIVAAVGQVGLFPWSSVLGASGGVLAVLGTLTILAPNMRVIFFVFPAPLWALTVFFVGLNLWLGAVGGAGGIAVIAHLVGLGIGLAYGLRLRRRGVLPRVERTWAFQRRP